MIFGFSRTHLNWPGFLEPLSFPKPKTISSKIKEVLSLLKSSMNARELKWLSLWQTIAKYLLQNLVCSPHAWIEPTIERRMIIGVKEKTYCSSVSMVWWHGYRDYRGFSKLSPWKYWPKKLFILTRWGTGKKLILIEGCWSNFFNLLPNYPEVTYWEALK